MILMGSNSLMARREPWNAMDGKKVSSFDFCYNFKFSVCACGKWICTSQICTEGYRDIETNDVEEEDDDDDDNESPEDDPDVKDIRWF